MHSSVWEKSKLAVLDRVREHVDLATLETADILLSVDQLGMMLDSFDELRLGKTVSMDDAFGDL